MPKKDSGSKTPQSHAKATAKGKDLWMDRKDSPAATKIIKNTPFKYPHSSKRIGN